jgi:predicted HAD superfamily Cof-like phosphohydrolase
MNKYFKQREEFNKAFNIEDNGEAFDLVSRSEFELEFGMLLEELLEYRDACIKGDRAEILDAIGDIGYLWFGMMKKHGVSLKLIDEALTEIHRSNMSKLHNGEIVKDEKGKVVKPDTYSPPHLIQFII